MLAYVIFFYTILAGFVNRSLGTGGLPIWVDVTTLEVHEIAEVDKVYKGFLRYRYWSQAPAVWDLNGSIWDKYLLVGVTALITKINAISTGQHLDEISHEAAEIILPLIYYNMVILDECKTVTNVQEFSRNLNDINRVYLLHASREYRGYCTRRDPFATEGYLVALTVQYVMDEEMLTHLSKNSEYDTSRFLNYQAMIDRVRTAIVLKFLEPDRLSMRLDQMKNDVDALQSNPSKGQLPTKTLNAIERFGMETLMIVATVGSETTNPVKAMSDLFKRVGEIPIHLDPGLVTFNTRHWDPYGLILGFDKYIAERVRSQPDEDSLNCLRTISQVLLTKLPSPGGAGPSIDPQP